MAMKECRPRRAWTQVEVVVVAAIVAVLLGLLMPAVQKVRANANQKVCQHNLQELALAVHAYHNDRGIMPAYATGKQGEIFGGWFIPLLPYAGHTDVYNQIQAAHASETGGKVIGSPVWQQELSELIYPGMLCPSDPGGQTNNKTNYLANWYALTDGIKGCYQAGRPFRDLTDGLSNVVLFAEGRAVCDNLPRRALQSANFHNFGVTQQGKRSDDPSYLPEDYTMFQVRPEQCDKWRAQTPHNSMNVALADGSVRTVGADISGTTWTAALKPRDGAALGSDW